MIYLVPIQVQGKSTMELLINKDWHEFNVATMKAHENFYIRFTGTQRIIVGVDSVGNAKARVQRYYLSNRYEESFDSTKVGKYRNGSYLIIQGDKNRFDRNTICLEIKKLKEDYLRVEDKNHLSNLERMYYSQEIKEKKTTGNIISTQQLLTNKIWYELDLKTGERTNLEYTYNNKYFVRCNMPENRKTQFPQWMLREYYLSDTIVTRFERKKVGKRINGRYIVVNELDSDGNWQAATYDIATLSENRLELECVYPKGYATQIFESSLYSQNAEHAKRKPQQAELMKDDWYRLDTITYKRSRYIERYTKTHVTRIVPIYSGEDTIELKKIYEYYMSNQPEAEFDWSKKGNASEGDYIVVNELDLSGNWIAVNYRVELLSGGNMVTVKEMVGNAIMQAYERDLSEDEQLKLASQQKMSSEIDTIKKKTIMDMLVGKQWRLIRKKSKDRSLQCYYFTESKIGGPFWRKTKGGYITEIRSWDYKLSNKPDYNFSYSDQAKRRRNGNHINYCGYYDMKYGGEKMSYNFKILYLSEKLMILETVPDPERGGNMLLRRQTHVCE